MPFTFPAHAAAAVPVYRLLKNRVYVPGLVVGTMAPDLAYIFRFHSFESHQLWSASLISFPIGLAALAWLMFVLLPLLRDIMPPSLGMDFPELFTVPGTAHTPGKIVKVGISVYLGMLTHLLLDGISHPGWWPARSLLPDLHLSVLSIPIVFEDLLWALLTVGLSLYMWYYCAQKWPSDKILMNVDWKRAFRIILFLMVVLSLAAAWSFLVENSVGRGGLTRNGSIALFAGLNIWALLVRVKSGRSG